VKTKITKKKDIEKDGKDLGEIPKDEFDSILKELLITPPETKKKKGVNNYPQNSSK
jgi:hypothetical protein